MASTWLLALFALLCLSIPAGAVVNCYLCSWSEEETNMTDFCSEENLQADRIGRVECENGCEMVKIMTPTGNMVNFFRNCAQSSGSTMKCDNYVQRDHQRKKCACNWNLCNNAPSWNRLGWTVLTLTCLVSGWLLHRYQNGT